MTEILDRLFTLDRTEELLALPFVRNALIAAALLGIVAGVLAPLIVARGMAFAVHGTAELAFTGGAAALLLGINVSIGAVAGAAIAVPIVGAILVLAVSVIPGAAAARVTASPLLATVLAVLIAELALLGGTVLSLAPGLPISGYVATIAFLCYLGCRLIGRLRGQVRIG